MPDSDAVSATEGVTAIHLSGRGFEVPASFAAEIFHQLEPSLDSTRAIVLTLSDRACILIAPDNPMVIFVPGATVHVDA